MTMGKTPPEQNTTFPTWEKLKTAHGHFGALNGHIDQSSSTSPVGYTDAARRMTPMGRMGHAFGARLL